MLMKFKRSDSTPICGQKTFRFLSRMTRNKSSVYQRMDLDGKEKKNKMLNERKAEDLIKGKENSKTLTEREVKEKKSKKKGWKKVGQVALTTCRYIGMGAAHMSLGTIYSSPDYQMDPKVWNKSFSHSYKPKVPPSKTHWTNTMMYSSW